MPSKSQKQEADEVTDQPTLTQDVSKNLVLVTEVIMLTRREARVEVYRIDGSEALLAWCTDWWAHDGGELSVPEWLHNDTRIVYVADKRGALYARGDDHLYPGRKPGYRLGSFTGTYARWDPVPHLHMRGNAIVGQVAL